MNRRGRGGRGGRGRGRDAGGEGSRRGPVTQEDLDNDLASYMQNESEATMDTSV